MIEGFWPNWTPDEWRRRVAAMKAREAVEKFNPYHRGEGPGGGQFTTAEEGGGVAVAGEGSTARDVDPKYATFHDAETRLLHQHDHETGMVLETKDGKPGVVRQGGDKYVEFQPEDMDAMEGAVFSHNHPSGGSFSADDLAMMARGRLREERAFGIAPDGRAVLHRVRPPVDLDARVTALAERLAKSSPPDLGDGMRMLEALGGRRDGVVVRDARGPVPRHGLVGIALGQRYRGINDRVFPLFRDRYDKRVASGMDEHKAQRLTSHEQSHRVMEQVAREAGLTYSRTYFEAPPLPNPMNELADVLLGKQAGVRFIDGGLMIWDGTDDYASGQVAKQAPPTIIYPGAGVDVPRRTNPPLSDAGQRRRADVASTYRRALEEGDRDALARIFRDRRSDRLIQRLIDGEATLNAEQIDRLVSHYERRFGRHLANVEDITEQRIKARDRLRSAWERLVDRPDIDRRRVTKTWITAQDEKVRDAHAAMDGMTIPFDALFPAPDTGDIWGPPQAYNCRCFVRFNYEDAPVEAPLGEEYEWPMPSGEEPVFEPTPDVETTEAAEHLAAEAMLHEIERLAEELGRRGPEMPGAEEAAALSLRERVEAMTEAVLHFARTHDPALALDLPAELRGLPARALREWVKLFERLALTSGDPAWATVAATAAVLAQRGLP